MFDRTCQPRSMTQPIWIAAQNGHAACVARLLQAAAASDKKIVDAANVAGKTPCSIAIELAHPEVVGVLVRAGADVRRASPTYYSDANGNNFDPSPQFPVQHAVDMTIRSYATKSCVACGMKASSDPEQQVGQCKFSRCGKCKLAYYCPKACQLDSWPSHKKCCKRSSTEVCYGDEYRHKGVDGRG